MTQHIDRPSEEPPGRLGPVPAAVGELLWRLAARQFREHERGEVAAGRTAVLDGGSRGPRCGRCGQPWPCSGRRLAELGLGFLAPGFLARAPITAGASGPGPASP